VEDENYMLAGLSSSSSGGGSNSRSSNGARPFSTNTQVRTTQKWTSLFLSFSCPVQPVCPFAALHADFAAACQCIQARAIHC